MDKHMPGSEISYHCRVFYLSGRKNERMIFKCTHCNHIMTEFDRFYYDNHGWYIRCEKCHELFNSKEGMKNENEHK